MIAERALGVVAGAGVEFGELVGEMTLEQRREVVQQLASLGSDGGAPAEAWILRRGVLQLEQMFHDRARTTAHRALQRAAQVLHLLDQVLKIQLVETTLAQQRRLVRVQR